MAAHRYIDRICLTAALLSLLLSLLFLNGQALGLQTAPRVMGYEARLFDASRVHTIDIVMDGWEDFLDGCEDEEYASCAVVVDGEAYKNVGIRAKGNASLSTVSQLGSDRYSFKVEFDHYESGKTYYGLDKLVLNNSIMDDTFMKDYLVYQMMAQFGAAAPLCSYAFITVNGQDWGLYLAVEGVEDGFLQRSYGQDHGQLYQPDSTDLGAGRGGGMGSSDTKLCYIDDDPDSYPSIFSSAKTNVTEADKLRLIQSLKALGQGGDVSEVVDIDQVLRYFVVHDFVVNGDSYTGSIVHNYYLYEEDGRLSMLPWDYDQAFGTFQSGDSSSAVNDPIDSPLSVTGDGDRPMADWIFSSEEYTELYHQYFQEFLDTVDPAAMIDETYALIASWVERDPTKNCTTEEFQTAVETLESFCQLRTQSVSGQLAGTIPSTSEGQAADPSSLVDASSLRLSGMSAMGGFGGGRGGHMDGDALPAFGAAAFSASDGGDADMPDRQPFGEGQRPDGAQDGAFGDRQLPEDALDGAFGDRQPPEDAQDGTFGDRQPPEDALDGNFGDGQPPEDALDGNFGDGQPPEDALDGAFGDGQPPDDAQGRDFGDEQPPEDALDGAFGAGQRPDGAQNGAFGGGQRPEGVQAGAFGGGFPGGGSWDSASGGDTPQTGVTLLLLGASSLVLLAGLAAAFKFKR